MLTKLVEQLLDLLFPPRCASCGGSGALFCASCRARLRPYPPEPPPPELDAVAVIWIYDEVIQHVVHTLKYRKRRRLAQPLGELMAGHLRAHPLPVDGVVPVPLHAGRLAERGFNQAEEIARPLARRLAVPLWDHGLVRLRDTGHQARLNKHERQTNVAHAFGWCGPVAPPARALLVDDIFTTGATLAACAAALRAAGAREVRAIALARSLPFGTYTAFGDPSPTERDVLANIGKHIPF